MESSWKFCPSCGDRPSRAFNFSGILQRMRKEMEGMTREMDQAFEKDIEAFDISPYFRKSDRPKGSGFSVRIISGTGMEPKVNITTFGDVDREKIREQVEKQLGYRQREKPVGAPARQKPASRLPVPKATEEPKTEVKKLDSRVVVDMELPGIKERDIEVNELEASVEVKAMAGDKAFFKILTKPEEFSIVEKKFEKGRLHLEFG